MIAYMPSYARSLAPAYLTFCNVVGGVISPLLANLFLHYAFDQWVERHWEDVQFERYADDIVCHCKTEREAIKLQSVLTDRFNGPLE